MILQRILRVAVSITFAVNMCLSQQFGVYNSQLPVHSARVMQGHELSRYIQGGSLAATGNTPGTYNRPSEQQSGGTGKRKKKTFKQIVQTNIIDEIFHGLLEWKQCEVPVEKLVTLFVPSSPLLSLAIGHFCSAYLFELLSPVTDPMLKPVFDNIERKVGPEAEERKRKLIFNRYGLPT